MARDDLNELSKRQLKERARDVGAKVSGTKQELIDRITEMTSTPSREGEEPASSTEDEQTSSDQPSPNEPSPDSQASDRGDRQEPPSSTPLNDARDAMRAARELFADTTGLRVELVPGVSRNEDGEWIAQIQATEVHRIPPSSDVVGIYSMCFDDDGALRSIERTARGRRDGIGA